MTWFPLLWMHLKETASLQGFEHTHIAGNRFQSLSEYCYSLCVVSIAANHICYCGGILSSHYQLSYNHFPFSEGPFLWFLFIDKKFEFKNQTNKHESCCCKFNNHNYHIASTLHTHHLRFLQFHTAIFPSTPYTVKKKPTVQRNRSIINTGQWPSQPHLVTNRREAILFVTHSPLF